MDDDRYILVIADGTQEMEIALEYACARSKKTNRKIIIATFIEPVDVLTTQGVTEIMKNEAREEAELRLQKASSIVKDYTGYMPVLHIKEGEIISELINLISKASGIFKKNIGKRVSLKKIPQLNFIFDEHEQYANQLTDLIDSAIENDSKK